MSKEYYFFDLKNQRRFLLGKYFFSEKDLQRLKSCKDLCEFYFILLQIREQKRGLLFDLISFKSIAPNLFLFFELAQNKIEFRTSSCKYSDEEYKEDINITSIADSVDFGIIPPYWETTKTTLNHYSFILQNFNLERYAWVEYCFCFMNGCYEDACPGLGSCSMADERIKLAVGMLIFCGVNYSSLPHVKDYNFSYLNERCFKQYKNDR